jgi:hypothetical protein
MPELSAMLETMNAAQLHSQTQNHHELKECIQSLASQNAATAASLNALIGGQIPITIQCHGIGYIGEQQSGHIVLAAQDAQATQLQVGR